MVHAAAPEDDDRRERAKQVKIIWQSQSSHQRERRARTRFQTKAKVTAPVGHRSRTEARSC